MLKAATTFGILVALGWLSKREYELGTAPSPTGLQARLVHGVGTDRAFRPIAGNEPGPRSAHPPPVA